MLASRFRQLILGGIILATMPLPLAAQELTREVAKQILDESRRWVVGLGVHGCERFTTYEDSDLADVRDYIISLQNYEVEPVAVSDMIGTFGDVSYTPSEHGLELNLEHIKYYHTLEASGIASNFTVADDMSYKGTYFDMCYEINLAGLVQDINGGWYIPILDLTVAEVTGIRMLSETAAQVEYLVIPTLSSWQFAEYYYSKFKPNSQVWFHAIPVRGHEILGIQTSGRKPVTKTEILLKFDDGWRLS